MINLPFFRLAEIEKAHEQFIQSTGCVEWFYFDRAVRVEEVDDGELVISRDPTAAQQWLIGYVIIQTTIVSFIVFLLIHPIGNPSTILILMLCSCVMLYIIVIQIRIRDFAKIGIACRSDGCVELVGGGQIAKKLEVLRIDIVIGRSRGDTQNLIEQWRLLLSDSSGTAILVLWTGLQCEAREQESVSKWASQVQVPMKRTLATNMFIQKSDSGGD